MVLAVVKAWHIPTASEFTLVGPKGRVLAMIVGNDTLFAAAEDGVISAWKGSSDANSPFQLVASLSGHTKAVSCLTVGLNRLYSGSMDQSIKVCLMSVCESLCSCFLLNVCIAARGVLSKAGFYWIKERFQILIVSSS